MLAVGDAEFQRKCLGKMQEASEHGRTVVFVSHDMQTVQRLCSRAYVIDKGGIVAEGTPSQAVSEYLSRAGPDSAGRYGRDPGRRGALPGDRGGEPAASDA